MDYVLGVRLPSSRFAMKDCAHQVASSVLEIFRAVLLVPYNGLVWYLTGQAVTSGRCHVIGFVLWFLVFRVAITRWFPRVIEKNCSACRDLTVPKHHLRDDGFDCKGQLVTSVIFYRCFKLSRVFDRCSP
jgi:hypothetical protein